MRVTQGDSKMHLSGAQRKEYADYLGNYNQSGSQNYHSFKISGPSKYTDEI